MFYFFSAYFTYFTDDGVLAKKFMFRHGYKRFYVSLVIISILFGRPEFKMFAPSFASVCKSYF